MEKGTIRTRTSFAGVDLTSSSQKPSAYALLGAGLEVRSLESWPNDSEIIEAVERDQPVLVAIDAPLSLPKGLCCMDEACSCQPSSERNGRLCERELARIGIPSYFTTKKSIIKNMVCRALVLSEGLTCRGYEVIEVYPYASKVRLWGRDIPRKTTPEGLEFLIAHLAAVIPGVGQLRSRLDHDLCDALIAAYTAYLHHRGRADVLGDTEEGLISIPSSVWATWV